MFFFCFAFNAKPSLGFIYPAAQSITLLATLEDHLKLVAKREAWLVVMPTN